jgi:beta-lactamase superfamily II metal-dependent hydrolase
LGKTCKENNLCSLAQPGQAKLDVVCRNGKLSAIALEPSAAIEKSTLSFTGVVPTTRVGFSFEGQANQSEEWAVLDGGRTLSPYSEVLQAGSHGVGSSASPA